jgi:hypothetical protein
MKDSICVFKKDDGSFFSVWYSDMDCDDCANTDQRCRIGDGDIVGIDSCPLIMKNFVKRVDLTIWSNSCDCNFCRGVAVHVDAPFSRVRRTGGRYPMTILLHSDDQFFGSVSAKQINSGNTPLVGDHMMYGGNSYMCVYLFPDSVHGCWKCRKNQLLVLWSKI